MAKRIFRAVCLISLWVFAASVVIIMWVLYDYYSENQRMQLKRQTNQVAEGVEPPRRITFAPHGTRADELVSELQDACARTE